MPSSSLVAAWERQTTSRHTGKMSRYDEWRKPPSQCRNLLQKHCQKQHVTQPDKYQILLLSPSEVSQAAPAHRGHPTVPEAPTRSPAVPGWSTRPRAAGRQWGEQPAAARQGTTHLPSHPTDHSPHTWALLQCFPRQLSTSGAPHHPPLLFHASPAASRARKATKTQQNKIHWASRQDALVLRAARSLTQAAGVGAASGSSSVISFTAQQAKYKTLQAQSASSCWGSPKMEEAMGGKEMEEHTVSVLAPLLTLPASLQLWAALHTDAAASQHRYGRGEAKFLPVQPEAFRCQLNTL